MRKNKAFTLVELLVVMALLSVLVSIIAVNFRNSQTRGRDVKRKSDLKQVSNALELYYSDYGQYPDTLPAWGTELSDGKTVYFKTLPKDPVGNYSYFYRIPELGSQKYQLFARIENSQDAAIIPGLNHSCGSVICNFAVTSSNTNPSE